MCPLEIADLLRCIWDFLEVEDLATCRLVNRYWCKEINELFFERTCEGVGLDARIRQTWRETYIYFKSGQLFFDGQLDVGYREQDADVSRVRLYRGGLYYLCRREEGSHELKGTSITNFDSELEYWADVPNPYFVCMDTLTVIKPPFLNEIALCEDFVTMVKIHAGHLFTVTKGGFLDCFESETFAPAYSYLCHTGPVLDLDFLDDRVFTIGDCSIHIWSHSEQKPVNVLIADNRDSILSFACKRRYLFSGHASGRICFWSANHPVVTFRPSASPITALATCSTFLASGNAIGEVVIWNYRAQCCVQQISVFGSTVLDLSLSGGVLVACREKTESEGRDHCGLHLIRFKGCLEKNLM